MTPLACAGHVLLDLPIFFGPVAVITSWILYISRRERRREQATTPPRAGHQLRDSTT